jgi:hypothetical protein
MSKFKENENDFIDFAVFNEVISEILRNSTQHLMIFIP